MGVQTGGSGSTAFMRSAASHAKGLLSFGGDKKPAWFDVQRLFAATPQLAAP